MSPTVLRVLTWLLVIAAGVALVVGTVSAYEHWRDQVLEQGDARGAARVQAQWDKDREAAAAATIAKQQADAAETMRRLEIQKRNDDAKAQRDAQIARDAAAARSAADSLRLRAAAYLHAAGCDGRAGDSALECVREATAKVAVVLGQCAQRYQQLAADADDARSRGLLCEQQYDTLTLKSSPGVSDAR